MRRLLVFIILICMAASTAFSVCKSDEARQISVLAEEYEFEKTIQKLNVKILKEERLLGIRIVYGFICGEHNYVFIDGKKVNIQIAYSDGILTIGYPVITGSY